MNIESVNKLVDKLKAQRGPQGVEYNVIKGAGHFFNNDGETEQMAAHVTSYLGRMMSGQKIAA